MPPISRGRPWTWSQVDFVQSSLVFLPLKTLLLSELTSLLTDLPHVSHRRKSPTVARSEESFFYLPTLNYSTSSALTVHTKHSDEFQERKSTVNVSLGAGEELKGTLEVLAWLAN